VPEFGTKRTKLANTCPGDGGSVLLD
jgi:hypothetical protein